MLKEITPDFIDYTSRMNRSVPGEGMANDPDNPYPFEAAPEFTVQREALEYLFVIITDEERYVDLLTAIEEGVPIMELSQVILFKGFTEGKWNPDLMMLLAEPLAYMLMALAERQGINYTIHNEELNDEAVSNRKLSTEGIEKRLKEKQAGKATTMLPEELQSKIEEVPIVEQSLLSQPQEDQPEDSDSLLAQQGV
tara:strand:- start:7924 stop:8511 length:588 start_codon:yes stop_codon:yes gene_type:complete